MKDEKEKPRHNQEIKIQLHRMGPKTLSFDMPIASTILDLRQTIAKKTNTPANHQRFLINGSVAYNPQKLSSFRLKEDGELHIFLRLKLGGYPVDTISINKEKANQSIVTTLLSDQYNGVFTLWYDEKDAFYFSFHYNKKVFHASLPWNFNRKDLGCDNVNNENSSFMFYKERAMHTLKRFAAYQVILETHDFSTPLLPVIAEYAQILLHKENFCLEFHKDNMLVISKFYAPIYRSPRSLTELCAAELGKHDLSKLSKEDSNGILTMLKRKKLGINKCTQKLSLTLSASLFNTTSSIDDINVALQKYTTEIKNDKTKQALFHQLSSLFRYYNLLEEKSDFQENGNTSYRNLHARANQWLHNKEFVNHVFSDGVELKQLLFVFITHIANKILEQQPKIDTKQFTYSLSKT